MRKHLLLVIGKFPSGFLSYDHITIDLIKVRLVCLTLCINILLSVRKVPRIVIQTQVVAGSRRAYNIPVSKILVHFPYDFSKWSFSFLFFHLKSWGSKCWLCSYLEQMGEGWEHQSMSTGMHVTLGHLQGVGSEFTPNE